MCTCQLAFGQGNFNAHLVAYYPLNGNFLDYSGNGNHATPHGGASFTADKWGNANSAVYLDGVDDWIETNLTTFTKGGFTILFQIRSDTGYDQMIMHKADMTTGNGSAFTLYFKDLSNGTGGYYIPSHNIYKRDTCGTAVTSQTVGSGNYQPQGVWSCIALAYERDSNYTRRMALPNTNSTLYALGVNGKRLDTCSLLPLIIGKFTSSNPLPLKGAIDEIRVYDSCIISPYGPVSTSVFPEICAIEPLAIANTFSDSLLCPGKSFTVLYQGGTFLTGNTVSVKLSNASGSFAGATTIGSINTTTKPGSITCSIPVSITPGTGYKIALASSNTVDTSINKKGIRITAYPSVTATATSPVCGGETLSLAATGTTGVSYSWVGPNAFTSAQQNPVISNVPVAAGGDYVVTATNYNCASKDTVNVVTIVAPAWPVAGSNGILCEGDILYLACSNAGTGVSYSWAGPNSFSASGQNPSLGATTQANSGDYIVTTALNGCIKKDTVTVFVKQTPVTPTAGNNGPVCAGSSLNLTSSSTTAGVTYSWTGPQAYSATTQNAVINTATTANSGTYLATASLNGCTSAAGTTIAVVNPIPATPTAASNSPACAGGVLNLLANSITPGVIYNWTGPNNFTSMTQNPTISPVPLNAGGTYNATAELNGCMSTGSGSTIVVINNVSSIGVYPSPNDTLCINNTNANLVAVPFNAGTAPQYQWYKNNTLVAGATNVSYPATGITDGDSFYCRMTVMGLCADPLIIFSNKLGMTVLPLTPGPSISITADPGTLLSPWQLVKFTAIATNAGALPKYQWKRNNQDVIGAMSDNWSANNLSNGDTISCVVTSDVWCASPSSAVSNRMVVNIKTGITDVDANRKLELYPNPNSGSFIVGMPNLSIADIEVLDMMGRVVYADHRSPIINQKLQISLPASVSNGVYMLKMSADGMVYHARFTVSR